MKNKVKLIPAVGLMSLALFGNAAQLNGQGTTPTGDYTNAVIAEVRDAQGLIVLRGQFVLADEEDDDIERKATLEPTGVDADAAGTAEVEFARAAPAVQEIEFAARNLQAGATFTFVIDGNDLATVTADRRGRVEVELKVRQPGAPASR
jgi:hypothetical protein